MTFDEKQLKLLVNIIISFLNLIHLFRTNYLICRKKENIVGYIFYLLWSNKKVGLLKKRIKVIF